MNKVYILLGGNLGKVPETIAKSIEQIKELVGTCIKYSNIYVSEPWGFDSEDYFYNQAIIVETVLEPQLVLDNLLKIESKLGRKRLKKNGKYNSRNIDIDILFYNDLILDTDTLTIPHPLMHLRSFALLPLVEIAPDFIHPAFDRTVVQILSDCEDVSYIRNLKQHDPSYAN
jgi:2-amino-4-hydroxy-6-hydroxymethyldihydropteridine diphosphokinase